MVSTRNHPKNFPPPDVSPAKSSGSRSSSPTSPTPSSTTTIGGGGGKQVRNRRSAPNRRVSGPGSSSSSSSGGAWVHAPSHLTIVWLVVSLPLVFWDVGYMLLRPYSMPGGSLHAPIWTPYALYGTIDYIYGWPAWEEHNGFSGAQSWMNVAESALYLWYLYIVIQNGYDDGRKEGRGATVKGLGWFGKARIVNGRDAGLATVIGFTASVMTVSKTVLYLLQEACSGWKGVGHNDASTLFFLWIVPNGAWIVLPLYMTYVFGAELLDGLAAASGVESPVPQLKDE